MKKLIKRKWGDPPIEVGHDRKKPMMDMGAKCLQCPLLKRPLVNATGPHSATHAIVGVAPHNMDIQAGQPFKGSAGLILDQGFEDTDLHREDFLITYACMCQPIKGSEPPIEALACCKPRLLNEVKGKKILAMGDTSKGILASGMEHRGVWGHSHLTESPIMFTYHPGFYARHREAEYPDLTFALNKFTSDPFEMPLLDYVIVETTDHLLNIASTFSLGDVLIFDLETSNKNMETSDPHKWWEGYILTCAFTFNSNRDEIFVITEELWHNDETLRIMKPMFEMGVIGHNIKFDVLYILHDYFTRLGLNIEIPILEDTMLLHFTLDERKGRRGRGGQRMGGHSLKILAGLYFDDPDYDAELDEYLPKKNSSYNLIPRPKLYEYCAKDVLYTYYLLEILRQQAIDDNLYDWPYQNVLMRATNTLTDTQRLGFTVMQADIDESGQALQVMIEEVEARIHEVLGPININSHMQVKKAVKKVYNLTLKDTSKDTLKVLIPDYPVFKDIIYCRRLKKFISSYINTFNEYIDDRRTYHADFLIHGAITGRLSGGQIMTVPRSSTPEGKLLRKTFKAPSLDQLPGWFKLLVLKYLGLAYTGRIPTKEMIYAEMDRIPGHGDFVILDADFSQCELRMGGWLSAEPFLFDVYEKDGDIHDETAIMVYGKGFKSEERSHCKNVNFGYFYGAGAQTLAKQADMKIGQAKQIIAKYDENMPVAKSWMNLIFTETMREGYTQSLHGRKRRFPLVTQNNKSEVKRQAVNFQVQAPASDLTLTAYCALHEQFKAERLPVWPVLFLHDGVYFICLNHRPLVEAVKQQINATMVDEAYKLQEEAANRFPVYKSRKRMPFKVDVEVKGAWG